MVKKKYKRKPEQPGEMQLIREMKTKGMSCALIARELKRSEGFVYDRLKQSDALAVLDRANNQLKKVEEHPLQGLLKQIVDCSTAEALEVEDIHIKPRERKVVLGIKHHLELRV